MNNEPKNLITLLETVILMQMMMENLEVLQGTHYNKSNIKIKIKTLLKEITPLAERDYNIVFNNGEKETQQIISEYESFIAQIRDFNVPQKVILTQMIQAFNLDKGAIEATVHRVLKKSTQKDFGINRGLEYKQIIGKI